MGTLDPGAAELIGVSKQFAAGGFAGFTPKLIEAARSLEPGSGFLAAAMTSMHAVALSATEAPATDIFSSACHALLAHSRWRAELPSSRERLAFDRRLSVILPIADDALAEIGEPRLVAEFIELIGASHAGSTGRGVRS